MFCQISPRWINEQNLEVNIISYPPRYLILHNLPKSFHNNCLIDATIIALARYFVNIVLANSFLTEDNTAKFCRISIDKITISQ